MHNSTGKFVGRILGLVQTLLPAHDSPRFLTNSTLPPTTRTTETSRQRAGAATQPRTSPSVLFSPARRPGSSEHPRTPAAYDVAVFGIDAEKLFVLLIIGALVLGPDKLPEYAAKLTSLIREVRRMAAGAQEQLRDELGPDFEDVDWTKFDPRQYDPRRIIRDALSDSPAAGPGPAGETPVPAANSKATAERLAAGQEPPFDSEAT